MKRAPALSPCDRCPFRTDVAPFIAPERVQEIFETIHRGGHFICHESVNYDLPEGACDRGQRVCAGMLLLQHHEGTLGQLHIVRLAERLLDKSLAVDNRQGRPVYKSEAAMLAAYTRAARPRSRKAKPS